MLPPQLISSLAGLTGFDEDSFCAAHEAAAPPVSFRVNASKWSRVSGGFELTDKVPWCKTGFYLPQRPVFTLDPLLHAGAYYVQEASSMFLEQALKKITAEREVKYALDLCAAPGGKSTHLLSLLPETSVLVSNEVIHNRNAILQENITKWGSINAIVTQNDPAEFGKLGPIFDLLLIDAPCSGSGLFRRDAEAIKEWSPSAVALCSQRQQRIIADVLPCLKSGGYLVYATCSYSRQENEEILDWMAENFDLHGIALDWEDGENGVVACHSPGKGLPCFRFFPGKVRGEGFFVAVLQKGGESELTETVKKGKKRKALLPQLPPELSAWISPVSSPVYYRHKEHVFLMTEDLFYLFEELRVSLNVRKAGVKIAEEAHGKFNPAHDFALSQVINPNHFVLLNLPVEQALSFLRKEDFVLPDHTAKGWILVCFDGLPLGWVKNLGNRINNYYPKEWRIRMK